MRTRIGRLVLDNTYDVPYLAGYNESGTVIYWDRKVPMTMPVGPGNKQINIVPFVALHEAVEQHLEKMFGMKYQDSHHIALGAERTAVEHAGLDWDTYNSHFQGWIKKCREHFSNIPPDLDLQPYKDSRDTPILNKIKRLRMSK